MAGIPSVCTCTPSGFMSDPNSICPFDLLDAAMRDPFLQQAFRQLNQRHLYGIIPQVCRSWHHLSTTSSSSLEVEVFVGVNEETGEPDDAISFSRWLQRNIGKLTRLDLKLESGRNTFDVSGMLQTISSATQLCSLRIDLDDLNHKCLSASFVPVSALSNMTSLGLCWCGLSSQAFSSMLALTQLRALELRHVGVDGAEERQLMPDLTKSLVNLTSLTLDNFYGWVDLESGLACIRSLRKLVDLDMRDTCIPSGNLVSLMEGIPITGVKICLDDPGHVSEVAEWLKGCVPSTLTCLVMDRERDLEPSQVARLLTPLRSAGAQLQVLELESFDLSHADSVSIITGLTQLTSLDLRCKFHDDGWALLKSAFAHPIAGNRERVWYGGLSWFRAQL